MKAIGSAAHMRRRAEAILKVLMCHGCASEVRIHWLLGDSPDTSKALRMSLSLSLTHTAHTKQLHDICDKSSLVNFFVCLVYVSDC